MLSIAGMDVVMVVSGGIQIFMHCKNLDVPHVVSGIGALGLLCWFILACEYVMSKGIQPDKDGYIELPGAAYRPFPYWLVKRFNSTLFVVLFMCTPCAQLFSSSRR